MHGCGGACGAVRHIEDVAADLDELRREVRSSERYSEEQVRKLWIRLSCLIVIIGAILPTEQVLTLLGII